MSVSMTVTVIVFVSIFIAGGRAVSVAFLVIALRANNFIIDLIVAVGS